MTLFDLPPLPEPEPGEVLSPDRRLKLRNDAAFAAGRHPATNRPLLEGETCGPCLHHWIMGGHAKNYHKCDLHRLGMSASSASDIRVSWPACELYYPEAEAVPCRECNGEGWVPLPPLVKSPTGATRKRCEGCRGRGLCPSDPQGDRATVEP